MPYKNRETRLKAERARRKTPEGKEKEAQKRLRYQLRKKQREKGEVDEVLVVDATDLSQALESWNPHGKRLGVPGQRPGGAEPKLPIGWGASEHLHWSQGGRD